MEPLDGLYRHRGAVVTWDREGVTLGRNGDRNTATLRWDQIAGARRVGVGPGYVQLLLQGHEPADDYRNDRFAFAVNSDHDANRLLTSIWWYSGAKREPPRRTPPWRAGLRRAGARIPRSPSAIFGQRLTDRDETGEQ